MDSFTKTGLPGRRDMLLKAVTIGVLLASTGVAWLIARSRSGHADRAQAALVANGTQVLAQIRNQGLDHHWPGDEVPRERWYLVYGGGRVKELRGWRAARHWREADGTHRELQLNFPSGVWEYWQLNGDGTRGLYEAGQATPVPGSPRLETATTTRITLRDGRAELRQYGPDGAVSEVDVPANYVPEGMLDLACLIAALRGGEAQFRLILNSDPPDGKTTRLATATISDIKQLRQGVHATMTISSAQGGSLEHELRFSRTGLLAERITGPMEERLVARETVRRILPKAAGYVADVFEQIVTSGRYDTPTTAPTTAPTSQPDAEGK